MKNKITREDKTSLLFKGLLTTITLALSTLITPSWAAEKADTDQKDNPEATRIILLGTNGGPPPNLYRSEPAALLEVRGKPYLIDAGAGTFHQLHKAGYFPNQVRDIFISHNHLDHNAGLFALLSESWILGNLDFAGINHKEAKEVSIWGPTGTKTVVDGLLQSLGVSARIFNSGLTGGGHFVMPPDIFKSHEISEDGVFFEDENIKVTATENSHFHFREGTEAKAAGDKSYAYRFDTPEGAIVYTGDTGPSEAVTELAKDADVLITEVIDLEQLKKQYEAMRLTKEQRDTLIEHMIQDHLTPENIGKMASKAGVKTVILYHIVPAEQATHRYMDTTTISAGVRKYFDGQIITGQDLFEYDLYKH